MIVKPKKTDKLKETKDYIEKWLKRYKKASESIPHIQRNLDITEWELQAIDNRPDEADEMLTADITTRFDRDYDYLKEVLPMMPQYNPNDIQNLFTITTSSSGLVYDFIYKVKSLNTPKASSYSEEYTSRYQDIQRKHERLKEVCDLIDKFGNPNLIQRFKRAENSYVAAKSRAGERTVAASEMRTLLEGIKGELFEKARHWQKENMTWKTMSERLSKGEINGTEQIELIEHETINNRLIKDLSTILKNREGDNLKNLDDIWTMLLDHLYVIFGLINLGIK